MEDPITLNTAPDDEPREWKAGRVKEYCDKNVSGLKEDAKREAKRIRKMIKLEGRCQR